MEELVVVIESMPVLQPSDVGVEQELDEGVQCPGKVKGKGHKEMELKLEIEDAQLDEEDDGHPALIPAKGGSSDETRGQVHQ
jgi:hypothetical protein